MPNFRFFCALALALFGVAGAYLTGLLLSSSYLEAQALEKIIFHDEGYSRLSIQASPFSFMLLKFLVSAVFLAAVGILWLSWRKGTGYELKLLWVEIKQAFRELINGFNRLPGTHRITAYAVLVALVLLRTFFSLTDAPDVDEIASFSDFVKREILAVIAFYPVPNNHIFSNLLAFLAYRLHPDFWFAMRLPTLLISTVGTAGLFLVLLRFSGFTIALLAMGLWGVSEMGLYYGYAGRGYAIFSLFAILGFFSVYSLSWGNRYTRLLWALLIVTSALGFYTVPAFLYSFLSLCVLVFFYWLSKTDYSKITGLLLAGLMVVSLTLFLYAPVFFVSGPQSVIGNSYVISLTWEKVFSEFYTHTQTVESNLLGIPDRGLTFVLAILLCFSVLAVINSRRNRKYFPLGIAACVLILLPFLWVLLQRVQPPSRIFFYKSFFLFLIIGIILNWLFAFSKANRKATLWLSLLLLTSYGTTQAIAMNTRIIHGHQDVKRIRATIDLVMKKEPESILITRPWYSFYFLHYIQPEFPELIIHNKPEPGQIYSSIITDPKEQLVDLGINPSDYTLGHSSNRIKVYFFQPE